MPSTFWPITAFSSCLIPVCRMRECAETHTVRPLRLGKGAHKAGGRQRVGWATLRLNTAGKQLHNPLGGEVKLNTKRLADTNSHYITYSANKSPA